MLRANQTIELTNQSKKTEFLMDSKDKNELIR